MTQWLETPKDNKEDSTDKKNQKTKQKQTKSIENNREQSINSNKRQDKKRLGRSKRIKNALKILNSTIKM